MPGLLFWPDVLGLEIGGVGGVGDAEKPRDNPMHRPQTCRLTRKESPSKVVGRAELRSAGAADRVAREYRSIEAVRLGEQRRDRVDGYLRAQVTAWSLFPLVRNLARCGAWIRCPAPVWPRPLATRRALPQRPSLSVPSEHSSGRKRRIGAITKGAPLFFS
jgi:hypothetical protein